MKYTEEYTENLYRRFKDLELEVCSLKIELHHTYIRFEGEQRAANNYEAERNMLLRDITELSKAYQYLTVDGTDLFHEKGIEVSNKYYKGPW